MAKKQKAKTPRPEAPPPAASAPKLDPRRLVAVPLLFSALLGIVAVLQFRHSPFHSLLVLDELSYFRWGTEIAGGEVIGKKIFYQDPLYPYFLGLLLSIFGPKIAVIRFAQVALGTATVGLIYAAGRRLFGFRAGLIGSCLLALCGSMYFFELLVLKATLVIFLSAVAIYGAVRAADETDPRRAWLSFFGIGFSLGLLCLLRANFLGLLPFALAWAWIILPGAPKARAGRAALLAAGTALVILPVTARNYAVGGELVLTTSQAGANFYIGNYPDATGAYGVISFVRPDPMYEAADFQAEAERRTGRKLRASEVSRFWFREGLKWIWANPGPAARLTLHKARLLIHQFEIPDNYSFALTRDYFVSALKLPFLGIGWLWGPALAAAWLLRRNRRLWFPAGLGILYAASIIPFFIVDRYRTPLLVPAALLTACLAIEVVRRVRSREYRGLIAAGAIMVAGLFIGLWPSQEQRFVTPIAAFNVGNAWFDLGNYEEAIRWYQFTLSRFPEDQASLRNLELSRKLLEAKRGRPQ